MNQTLLILIISIVAFCLICVIAAIAIKNAKISREKKKQKAAYHAIIEGYVKDFKKAHSSLTFEIKYNVLNYQYEEETVLYYITGDPSLKEYFSQQKKNFYQGFSYLVEYSVLEHIIVYINGSRWVEIENWFDEEQRCRK